MEGSGRKSFQNTILFEKMLDLIYVCVIMYMSPSVLVLVRYSGVIRYA